VTRRDEPVVGNWYQDQERRTFEVVAVDEDQDAIEIQHFGGEVEEVDFDSWYELEVDVVAPPEDPTGVFDDLARDDLGDTERPPRTEDWSGPWNELDLED